MRRSLLAALVTAVVLPHAALAASNPNDQGGLKDHPDVPRFPNTYILDGTTADFDAHEFQIGKEKTVSKEGRSWKLQYRVDEEASKGKRLSTVELFRNYENAFKKNGGKVVAKDTNAGEPWITLTMPVGKSERWLEVMQTNGDLDYYLRIIDVAAMDQKIEVSATEMLGALKKNGFIGLYGIQFDTNKADIKPESEATLAEILALMKLDPSLKLSVDGHTDNVGDKKANQALSLKRAEAVVKHLVGKGADAKRLTASGLGDTLPIADNRLDEGRAKNRRVELVKK